VDDPVADEEKRPGVLRFLTLNLWGENGPWQARMDLLLDSLAPLAPDVICLQEVRDVPGRVPNQAGEIARRHGWNHVFAPSTAWGGGHEGLAIVSRFPIGAHEAQPLPHSIETEGRIILSARVDADTGAFWAHTTHLAFRETEGRKREDQVLFIDQVVAAHANDNIQIVTGDFNAVPDSDEIRWLKGMTTLDGRRVAYQDVWARANAVGSGGADRAGITWASMNPYVGLMHWLHPDRRLDYIFTTQVRRDRRGSVHGARVVFDEPGETAAGERVFISDHFGVIADIQMVAEPPHAAP
jgi:endonuclease/exonuclease/phosphatase family metal-dependent hydrolase